MLIPISNTPRAYSWGSPDLIPALEGRTPSGEPEAEIWYGDHPGSPSRVDGPAGGSAGGLLRGEGATQTLDAALAAAGEPPLTFLLKILAAGSSLSIQAHPTKGEAVRGFAREEAAGVPRDADHRLYRDDNHKPEIIVALSDEFRALVGLRPPSRTRRLLALLGGGPAIAHLGAVLAGADAEASLRAALEWSLASATPGDVAELAAALDSAASGAAAAGSADGGEFAEFAEEIVVLRAAASDFPGDRGLFVALLMNLVVLHRGEALFAPAGVLHAYQSGLGVELMAASDNVLRGGLTPKHVDVPELLRVLDSSAGPAPRVVPTASGADAVVYDAGVPDFALTRADVAGESVRVALRGPAIALVTSGEVTASADGDEVPLAPGKAVYVGGGAREVTLSGNGEVFVAQSGTA